MPIREAFMLEGVTIVDCGSEIWRMGECEERGRKEEGTLEALSRLRGSNPQKAPVFRRTLCDAV